MYWNLIRLAESLLPLLNEEAGSDEAGLASAKESLAGFAPQFEAARLAGLRRKLGLLTEQEGDLALAESLLERMAANHADFTLTFRRLCDAAADIEADAEMRTLFAEPSAYDTWATQWRNRLSLESSTDEERSAVMKRANPAFIPRNHRVEEVITAAITHNNLQPFEELLEVVTHPYDEQPAKQHFSMPALAEQLVHQTFCGT